MHFAKTNWWLNACAFFLQFVFLILRIHFFFRRKKIGKTKAFEFEKSSCNIIRATRSVSMNIGLYVHAGSMLGMNSVLIAQCYLQKRIIPFSYQIPHWKPYKCNSFHWRHSGLRSTISYYIGIPLTFFASTHHRVSFAWKTFNFSFKQSNCYYRSSLFAFFESLILTNFSISILAPSDEFFVSFIQRI